MDEQQKVTAVDLYNTLAKGERMVIYVGGSLKDQTQTLPSTLCAEELIDQYHSFLSSEEAATENDTSFGSWLRFEYGEWAEYPRIYCYTTSFSVPSSSSPSSSSFWEKWSSLFPSIENQTIFLQGGLPSFALLFPGVCQTNPPLDPYAVLPACILPPQPQENGKPKGGGLFLGSMFIAQNLDTLSALNIRTIVNCSIDLPFPSPPSSSPPLSLFRVPVDDFETESLGDFFPEFTSTIHTSLNSGEGAVLVHCSRGASRSVSMVVAYLIRFYDLSFEEGLDFVKKKRPEAAPNPGFVTQLKSFATEWKGHK